MKDCKFSYGQEVTISKGFYRGMHGVVQELKTSKEGDYTYKVKLENNKIEMVEETNLKRRFKLNLPF